MNSLQEKRLALGLTQPQVSEKLKEVEPRADVGMVSRYEKGVCLPTRPQLDALADLYGVPKAALYEPEDLDLLGGGAVEIADDAPATVTVLSPARTPRRDRRGEVFFRKCFRISRKFEESLPDDLLQVCGYTSWQSWYDAALKRLLGEYAARKRGLAVKGARAV